MTNTGGNSDQRDNKGGNRTDEQKQGDQKREGNQNARENNGDKKGDE